MKIPEGLTQEQELDYAEARAAAMQKFGDILKTVKETAKTEAKGTLPVVISLIVGGMISHYMGEPAVGGTLAGVVDFYTFMKTSGKEGGDFKAEFIKHLPTAIMAGLAAAYPVETIHKAGELIQGAGNLAIDVAEWAGPNVWELISDPKFLAVVAAGAGTFAILREFRIHHYGERAETNVRNKVSKINKNVRSVFSGARSGLTNLGDLTAKAPGAFVGASIGAGKWLFGRPEAMLKTSWDASKEVFDFFRRIDLGISIDVSINPSIAPKDEKKP